ncbi:hypothetical protein LR48_Vigan06g088100 [Vigna angularis]|uniref:Uncharacterized protein n=1 Tax=Phaseolus angularis TaxID=3914 RepID=A0A0L9URS8_PHAAN|nr:hypothetical protein LR48_Vigan06g088100 [Vigna angularis]
MEESLAMKCLSGYIAFYSINYSTATTAGEHSSVSETVILKVSFSLLSNQFLQ